MARSKKNWNRKQRQNKYRCLHLATAEYVDIGFNGTKTWWQDRFRVSILTSWVTFKIGSDKICWTFRTAHELNSNPITQHETRHQRCEFDLVKVE